MLSVDVYSKPDCVYCTRAKMLLASHGYGYTKHVIGTDLSREQFLQLFPNARTVPQIIINGKLIGGYDNLVEYFEGMENGFGEQSI